MNDYELFNEKTTEFISPYLSDKMLERGDIITFQGENYFVFNLLMPKDRKLIVAVWPVKIYLPGDIEDLRLLNWIQKNLKGMKIRLSNDKGSIEGVVINYWPGIRVIPPDNLRSGKKPETFYAEEFPCRLEFLTLGPDNPTMIDLLDYTMIEILSNKESFYDRRIYI
jgi:hypothetical protein